MRDDRHDEVRTARRARPLRRRSFTMARIGAIAGVAVAMVGVATGGLAGAATTPTYTASATSTGAEINLFGTELTGGSATVAVDTSAPSVTAAGSGTLTPALVESQKASVTADGQSQNEPQACAQGGGSPSGLPVGITLGLACASASASLSSDNLPSGTASGELAELDVNVAGLLNEIISGGANQLFSALQGVLGQLNTTLGTGTASCPSAAGSSSSGSSSSDPASALTSVLSTSQGTSALSSLLGTLGSSGSPLSSLLSTLGLGSGSGTSVLSGLTGGASSSSGSTGLLGNLLEGVCQTLTNIENVVASTQAPNTLVVKVGPATASIVGTSPDAATATAEGATLDVQILPGVGCTGTLTECITDASAYAAPLIEVKVADAKSVDTYTGTSWSPSGNGSVAEIDLNIPGFDQSISLTAGQSQDLLAGTPLETDIDLGSASTSGTTSTANGATLDLLKGVSGGVLLNLGSTTATGTGAPATAAATSSASSSTAPVTLASGGGVSPTTVHTGEFWAGSLPFLVGLGTLGMLLIAWPRLRRTSAVIRLMARARR